MRTDQSERPGSPIQLPGADPSLPTLEERGEQLMGFADPQEMREMARLLRVRDDTPRLSPPALERIVRNVRSGLPRATWLTDEEPRG